MLGRILFVCFAALVGSAAPAYADCDHFKWPLAREKAWFAAAPAPVDAGAEIAARKSGLRADAEAERRRGVSAAAAEARDGRELTAGRARGDTESRPL